MLLRSDNLALRSGFCTLCAMCTLSFDSVFCVCLFFDFVLHSLIEQDSIESHASLNCVESLLIDSILIEVQKMHRTKIVAKLTDEGS